MGMRFRKSVNFPGGMRLNASKTGLSYSLGGKGFRVTKTAKGTTRTNASIPGSGISYVKETKSTCNAVGGGSETGQRGAKGNPLGCLVSIGVFVICIFVILSIASRGGDTKRGADLSPAVSENQDAGKALLPAKSNTERAEDILSSFFKMDLIELEEENGRYEIIVEVPGVSDREICRRLQTVGPTHSD